MKFNIIKIMVGTDKLLDEDTLYKHCHDSVLKEFPDDNIIIFRSFEEIEQKYGIPHFEHSYIRFISDYYRIQLTKYIDNYLYLDHDIMPLPGFRNELIRIAENNNSAFGVDGFYIIYSKIKNNLSNSIKWLLNNPNVGKIGDTLIAPEHKLKETIPGNYFFHYYNFQHFKFKSKIIITNDEHLIINNDENLVIILIKNNGFYKFDNDEHRVIIPEDQLDFVLKYYFTNPNKVVLDLRY